MRKTWTTATQPQIASVLDPQPGDLVLEGSDTADRIIADAVAARRGLPALTAALGR